MTGTADRWWVRVAARWLARVDGVSGQIRLAMLLMTGLSTATLSLRQYGLGRFALPLIGVTGVGLLVFTYLYTEGGVWNQMARDRADLSGNYATPRARINTEMAAMAYFAAIEGRKPDPEERETIEETIAEVWADRRDGVELEEPPEVGRGD